jgi:hypothetical protein
MDYDDYSDDHNQGGSTSNDERDDIQIAGNVRCTHPTCTHLFSFPWTIEKEGRKPYYTVQELRNDLLA